jgi:CRP-like cAMP-binding protein
VDRDQVLFRLFGKYCAEGTILSTEGAPGEEVYVIQSGAVRLGAGRTPEATTVLGPGELLGEEAFFGRAPRAARAEAVQDTRLIQVNDRTLDAVVRHSPRTARRIIERLLILGPRQGELAA